MHKKLEAELISLAHRILQMKNEDDVIALHKKSQEVFERLSVLKFVNKHISKIPNLIETKEDVISTFDNSLVEEKEEIKKVADILEKEIFVETKNEEPTEVEVNSITKEKVNEASHLDNELEKDDILETSSNQPTLDEELKNVISSDVATTMFEKIIKENPAVKEITEEKIEEKKRSLNDTIFKDNIQVGLNDRIAFVKHLFSNNQEDFNRVLSQLNSFDTEKEAISFLYKFVKPDYNWIEKEEYEQRLITLIKRKFL